MEKGDKLAKGEEKKFKHVVEQRRALLLIQEGLLAQAGRIATEDHIFWSKLKARLGLTSTDAIQVDTETYEIRRL